MTHLVAETAGLPPGWIPGGAREAAAAGKAPRSARAVPPAGSGPE